MMGKSTYIDYLDVDGLIKEIDEYLHDFDKEKFKKAFLFAVKAHTGQLRKDKKTPYIIHPIMAVKTLISLHADQDILIAALLHDIPEDTKYDISVIKRDFGEKVAFLVDGITKLSKVHYRHNMPERQVESLKKMFLHSAEDPGVVLIKLADRLHNMQTLEFIQPEKRLRIARETLEIFVPMANLLGLQRIKAQLEDLCFKYLFPTEYKSIYEKTEKKREKLSKVQDKLISLISASCKKADLPASIDERKQSYYSIYKKLSNRGKSINNIEDRLAIRIIVKNIPQCYQVLGIIHGIFTPKLGKFKDYVANPKINKYQSLHTMIFGPDGVPVKIQIRTEKMHMEAIYGIAVNFFEKSKKTKEKIIQDVKSTWVNKIFEIEKNGNSSNEFIENLKGDLLEDRIFIFTPKGGQIDLPRGASAIDFAYAIHTHLGDKAVKSEVNGNMMPITATLKNGDVVNIITDKNSSPHLTWLSFAKTNFAKNNIHAFLKKTGKTEKIEEGKKILQKEFDIAGLGLIGNINFKKIKEKIVQNLGKKYDTFEDLLIEVGEGNIKAVDIAKTIKIVKEAKVSPSKKAGLIKVNVRVSARNRFGLLRDIASVFYKYSVDIIHFRSLTSRDFARATFNVQVVVNDIENVGYIFNELEQIEDVKSVYRIPYKILYLTYALMVTIAVIWVSHPFIFKFILDFPIFKKSQLLSDIVVYGGLFLILFSIICGTNIVKNYFPFVRKKQLLWIVAFGLPPLVISSLLIDIYYFNLELSWVLLLVKLGIIYVYFSISLFHLRKTMKNV